MNQIELIQKLEKEGYYKIKHIEGRGLCGLREFLFTIGLCYGLEESSYAGRYCYPKDSENRHDSDIALDIWDGKNEPVGGWVKHKGISGEWSNPNT